jgi:hypothetical protein
MKIEWDFEKGLLAFMALLILGGIGVIAWQRGVAEDLNERLPTAENQLAFIGQSANEIHALRVAIRDDEMAGGMEPFDYLELQEQTSKIGKKFRISPGTEEKLESYSDTLWELKPTQANLDFSRQVLGTFLIHIEAKTTLMKITRIKLDVSTRRGATADDWRPLIEVTERRATTN